MAVLPGDIIPPRIVLHLPALGSVQLFLDREWSGYDDSSVLYGEEGNSDSLTVRNLART